MHFLINVKKILEDSLYPAFVISKENKIIMANEAFCAFLGKDLEDIIGKACFEIVHSLKELPTFCPLCSSKLESCVLTGCTGEEETLCPYCPGIKETHSKGIYTKEFFEPKLKKFLRVNLIPLYSETDELIGYLHFIEDKTLSLEIAKLFEELVSHYPGLFFITDEKFNIIYMNETLKKLCKGEGDKCYQVIYGFQEPCVNCPMFLGGQEGVSQVFSPKLRRYFQRYFKKISLSTGKIYKITLYTDITEEIRNFEEAAVALSVSTREGKILKANRRARELFEIDRVDLLNKVKTLDFWVNSKDRERFWQELLEKKEVKTFEAPLKTYKGKSFFALISAKVYQDEDEVLVYSAIEDITPYLKAKEESWKLLEYILDFLPLGVAMINKESKCIYVNKKLSELTGYLREELIGKNLHELLIAEEENRVRACKVFTEISKGKRSELARKRVEFLARKKDGKTFLAEIYFDEFFLDGERYFIGAIQDVTERKKFEERLYQEEKELVIEKIAGGLAHDLNNLLMIGKGYLELLEEKCRGIFAVEKIYIEKVREVLEKISHLVLELFILSKGEIKREEIVEINSFIKKWVNFLLTGTKIIVKLELSPYDLFVPLQESHLISLVSNIVLNAREAMENVGELRVKVYKEGDLAVLEFEDTGKGIPREYLDKIFEPGFSTKPHGSGLGLFVVKRIVENYKGEILVRSEEQKGTTFIIKLPLATPKKRVVEEEKRVKERPIEKKKILILEDEAEIRELLKEYLSEQGFEVALFEEGDSAYEGFLQALEEKNPFHILLLDLTVPMGKGGVYFLRRLKEAGINLRDYKIILMTGYTEKEVKEEAKGFEFNAVLYKPFSIQKLIEAIN